MILLVSILTVLGRNVLSHKGSELLLVVPEFTGIKIVVLKVGDEGHFAFFVDDICGVNFADPGVNHYLFYTDI